MKFTAFTKSDGQAVVVNIAHIVAMYEAGQNQAGQSQTRIMVTSGDDFYVDMGLASVHEQVRRAVPSN